MIDKIKIGNLYSQFKDNETFYVVVSERIIGVSDYYYVIFLNELQTILYDASFVEEDAKS